MVNITKNPHPERIAAIVLNSCEFIIGWDGEPGEPETYCDENISVPGSEPKVWVVCVKLDGKWWDARDTFSSEFCDQLDSALLALENFRGCTP